MTGKQIEIARIVFCFGQYNLGNMQQNIDKTFIITQKLKRPKSSKGLSKIEALYEEVIQKNFQTIDELLKRLSNVVIRHDEFEIEFQLLTKRLCKLENDLETIHNQHRRDNLHIAANINGIRTQIIGIDTQFKMLFQKVEQTGFSALLQNKFALKRNQSIEYGSLISSTHKISQNQLLLNFDTPDQQFQIIKRHQNQAPFSIRDSLRHPSIISSPERFRIQNEQKNEELKQTKSRLNLPMKVLTESRLRLQKDPLCLNNASTTKNSKFLTQKNQQESILYYLQVLSRLLNQSKGIQEDAKVEIVASFARNKTKIASLFQEASKTVNTIQARANFNDAIRQIFSQDEIFNSKFNQGSYPIEISEQISQMLFEKFFQKLVIQQQTKALIQQAVQKEILDLNTEIQELRKKDKRLNEIQENFKIKIQDIDEELRILKEKSLQSITEDKLFCEMVKIVQKSQKRWEQYQLNFANKHETIKAITFLSSKINDFICNSSQNGKSKSNTHSNSQRPSHAHPRSYFIKNSGQKILSPQNKTHEQNIQTKCLCCASTIIKCPTPRKISQTVSSSLINEKKTRILKPNQLKKKALEIFKNKSSQDQKCFL